MAFVSPRPCALSSRSVATIAGEEKGVGVLCMIKREGREEEEGRRRREEVRRAIRVNQNTQEKEKKKARQVG